MMQYVWCKNEECRIPVFRCILCRLDCYELRERARSGEFNPAYEALRNSGRYKEYFIMKRKEASEAINQLSFFERNEERSEKKETMENPEQNGGDKNVFLFEEGKIKAFSADEYTTSTLYQAVESFSVECRLVRPEEPGNMIFEGKKPSRKTVPILVKKNGECVIMSSWEELESEPAQLAETRDVVGAMPVKQVFVLKRK
ncbi:MAG: hypothetical protein ABFD97_12210 [Syntrophobacter sp.]